jgi:hypothetical protein
MVNVRGTNVRRSNSNNSTKCVILVGFSFLLIVGTLVYLSALSAVSGGLDVQLSMQERMMNDAGGNGRRKKIAPRKKRKEGHPQLRREEVNTDGVTADRNVGATTNQQDSTYDDDEKQETEPIVPVLNGLDSKSKQSIEEPPTPPWHLVADPDDSFERIYISDSERSKYKFLRDLGKGGDVNKGKGIKSFFNPMCRHYRFDESMLPTVSVIMTSQNEPDDWISISVESIPPNLLKEVIVVDDNGIPGQHGLPDNIRRNVDENEWEYIKSLSPKVKVIQHSNREGCARSRLSGAKAATGEVLMFVDSHIEMLSSTWYHHLVIPIVENPKTLAMQTIDVIDDLGTKDYGAGAGPLQYGIINTEFWFGYQVDRFGDYMEPLYPQNFTKEEIEERSKMKYTAERPGNRFPYETPFGPGSLFAIRADEFWRLGGYDEGECLCGMR